MTDFLETNFSPKLQSVPLPKIRNSLPSGSVIDVSYSCQQYLPANLHLKKVMTSRTFNVRYLVIAIAMMTFANALFNSLASENGYGYPYSTFLELPQDRYGDLIKYPLSFRGLTFQGVDKWDPLYQKYLYQNDYLVADALNRSHNTSNLHTTPLVIILTLIIRWIIWTTNPSCVIYLFIFGTTILSIAFTSVLYERITWYWLTLGLLVSYPFLIMITRGNYGSAVTSATLIFSMVNCLRKKYPLLTAFLIAIAINIRPNSAVFVCLLFIYDNFFDSFRYILYSTLLAIFIALISYDIAHWLYPQYTFNHMLLGLDQYYKIYVIKGKGLCFGSSFWGILQILHFTWPAFNISFCDKILLLICLFILVLTLAFFWKNLLTQESFIMLVCLDYCLFSSPVFADYHLLCLYGMLLIWALKEDSALVADATWLEKVGICLLLSPKNYWFLNAAPRLDAVPNLDAVSYQVLLNPEILLFLIIYRLYKAAKPVFTRAACKSNPHPIHPETQILQ